MIDYRETAERISPSQLTGFFVGWPKRPTTETHLRLLESSFAVALAVDTEADRVVGFGTAISDGVMSAYIPFLEVLPEYQRRGIGRELFRRLLTRLDRLYMIDVVCDQELMGFYESRGMVPGHAMVLRHRENQAGATSAG